LTGTPVEAEAEAEAEAEVEDEVEDHDEVQDQVQVQVQVEGLDSSGILSGKREEGAAGPPPRDCRAALPSYSAPTPR
jgi:hypothetical protein